MTKKDRVTLLISYLRTLSEMRKDGYQCNTEIGEVFSKLEKELLAE